MHIATAPPEELYPELPKEMDGLAFVFRKISALQKQLEGKRDVRAALYKKYRRAVNATDAGKIVLVIGSMMLGLGA